MNTDFTTHYTKTLAEYFVNLKYEDIPAEVLERAKLLTLHALGVSIAGFQIKLAADAASIAEQMNGGEGGEATIWYNGKKVTPALATFANSVACDLLDWEDCAWTGHPLCGAVPAGIAYAEAGKKSGKDYLTALIAGLEGYNRIAMAVQPPADFDHMKGWAICSWQIFASNITAGKLLGLDASQTNKSVSLAGSLAKNGSNISQATMSDGYKYEQGSSALSGCLAALCAQAGIHNMEDGLDIPYAFCEQYTPEVHREWLDRNLGKDYYTMDILVKHWPANMWVQTPVELTRDMVRKYNIPVEDIEEIVIDPPTQYRMRFKEDGYTSLTEAQFSMPYVVAASLLDPTPGANWYTDEMMKNPKLIELARKVKGGPSPEHTLIASFNLYQSGSHPTKTATIRTKDGKVYVDSMSAHKGHPLNMLTRDEFCELFRIETRQALSPEAAEKMIDFILHVEDVEDMSVFSQLLK